MPLYNAADMPTSVKVLYYKKLKVQTTEHRNEFPLYTPLFCALTIKGKIKSTTISTLLKILFMVYFLK